MFDKNQLRYPALWCTKKPLQILDFLELLSNLKNLLPNLPHWTFLFTAISQKFRSVILARLVAPIETELGHDIQGSNHFATTAQNKENKKQKETKAKAKACTQNSFRGRKITRIKIEICGFILKSFGALAPLGLARRLIKSPCGHGGSWKSRRSASRIEATKGTKGQGHWKLGRGTGSDQFAIWQLCVGLMNLRWLLQLKLVLSAVSRVEEVRVLFSTCFSELAHERRTNG